MGFVASGFQVDGRKACMSAISGGPREEPSDSKNDIWRKRNESIRRILKAIGALLPNEEITFQ
jgi:hypothetical protein